MSVVRMLLFIAVAILGTAALAQSGATGGSGYPNEDYFWIHTQQESWDQVNDVYQAAVDRSASDQRALDDE